MLSKLGIHADQEPSIAESLADLFFEIGKDQAGKSHHTESLRWLTRAYDAVSGRDVDDLSSDAPELLFSIMHHMVRAHISLKAEENVTKAWDLVQDMQSRYGDKLAVLLLKLDLYVLDPAFPPQDYCDVLHNIVQTVHLTDTNIKTALHHIHRLRARNVRMAHTVLVSFLLERLVGADAAEWLGKTLVTVIWNCTACEDFGNASDLVSEVLNSLHAQLSRSISPSAIHAAQIVSLSSSFQ